MNVKCNNYTRTDNEGKEMKAQEAFDKTVELVKRFKTNTADY